MEFKVGDVVKVKDSVVGGYTYDGEFIDDNDFILTNDYLIVRDIIDDKSREGNKLLSFYGIPVLLYPANIFNKVGELDTTKAERNTTHYFKSKKHYASLLDYLLSFISK